MTTTERLRERIRAELEERSRWFDWLGTGSSRELAIKEWQDWTDETTDALLAIVVDTKENG